MSALVITTVSLFESHFDDWAWLLATVWRLFLGIHLTRIFCAWLVFAVLSDYHTMVANKKG